MTEAEWLVLEDTLFRLTEAELRSFAASHEDETFYGFAFATVQEYGELTLNLNSKEHLRASSAEQADRPPDWLLRNAAPGPLRDRLAEAIRQLRPPTPDDIERESRWSPNGWKYAGFESDAFKAAWASYADDVLEARHEEPDPTAYETETEERFVRSICRVLVRLERERVFDGLSRKPDFKGIVRDRWDSEDEAWERLASVRAELG